MAAKLELEICDPTPGALAEAARRRMAAGPCRVAVGGPLAPEVRRLLDPLPETATWIGEDDVAAADLIIRTEIEGAALASALQALIGLPDGTVIAPRTDRHGLDLPLFLISIPKSGTHLLTELARALGYGAGMTFEHTAAPGNWYYLEHSNSHTAAPDFFIDTVRRSHFGNRLHPFPSSPCLFIYRHPLDILVSEANYYHREGKTVFAGYLSHLTFEERLLRLADDPWLMGSLKDRIGKFAAWLDFGNVVPLSFEELVGAAGGGDGALQVRAVWSVMLKLQVGGDATAIAGQIFNPHSATFEKGQIGRHRDLMTPEARAVVDRQGSAVFDVFGYQPDGPSLSSRVEEFRSRPLSLAPRDLNQSIPAMVEANYLGMHILQYRGRFFAFPCEMGIDLAKLPDDQLALLPQAEDIKQLRTGIVEGLVRREMGKVSAVLTQALQQLGNMADGMQSRQEAMENRLRDLPVELSAKTEALVEQLVVEFLQSS